MKEALIGQNLDVEIREVATPKPGPGEVLIRIKVAGSNPKDWKNARISEAPINSGDDMAGIIEAVGDGVLEFKPRDRVAAMHVVKNSGGSFSEYGIAPATTTFHIPKNVDDEEAATIPLAALTAALGLYWNLELPSPWKPAQSPIPLIIYGASSAVGAFAVKLAQKSNIHPIIAIAGKSKGLVEDLLDSDSSNGDVVIDYRDGPESNIMEVQKVLSTLGLPGVKHAFDTIAQDSGLDLVSKMMMPGGHITSIEPGKDYSVIPESLKTSLTYVPTVHGIGTKLPSKGIRHVAAGNGQDFGYVFSRLFTRGLQDGWLTGHPFEVRESLASVSNVLKDLRDGKNSGTKYVIKIA